MTEEIIKKLEQQIKELNELVKTMENRKAMFESYLQEHHLEKDYEQFLKKNMGKDYRKKLEKIPKR